MADTVSMMAHIELAIEKIIEAAMWRQPWVAHFMIANLGTEKLVLLAERLLVEALPEHQELAASMFKAVRQGREQRNKLLHRVWRPAPDGASLKMVPRPGRTEEATRDLTAFQSLSNELAETTIGLTLLQAQLTRAADIEKHRDQLAKANLATR